MPQKIPGIRYSAIYEFVRHELFFFRYSPQKRAKIGAYACVHGAAAAARHYSNKMGTSVSEATVKSTKSCYKDELRKQQTGTGS